MGFGISSKCYPVCTFRAADPDDPDCCFAFEHKGVTAHDNPDHVTGCVLKTMHAHTKLGRVLQYENCIN